ncbi:hypothetical protein Nans01_35130 [Nocardiopsis ansamitocini]|uniref:Uncharacterized protein n=1 Tax=Nocardiopsis ansamitocini TaxID=1670832 RepID=A0A9W6P8X8_9ACTN|nr:hypothetical protein Nans01_35130 [Nocardiopsis ansamitocini]
MSVRLLVRVSGREKSALGATVGPATPSPSVRESAQAGEVNDDPIRVHPMNTAHSGTPAHTRGKDRGAVVAVDSFGMRAVLLGRGGARPICGLGVPN